MLNWALPFSHSPREGRDERNIVLVLKEEATKRPKRAIYRHRREIGDGEHARAMGLSKGPSGGFEAISILAQAWKPWQPQHSI